MLTFSVLLNIRWQWSWVLPIHETAMYCSYGRNTPYAKKGCVATRDLQPPVWKPSSYNMWEHVAQQGIKTCSILGFASLSCCRNTALQRSQHWVQSLALALREQQWHMLYQELVVPFNRLGGDSCSTPRWFFFSFGLMLFTTPAVIQVTSGLSTIDQVPEQLLCDYMYEHIW